MKRQTLSLRHKFVKALAPKLFSDWRNLSAPDSLEIERPMISFLKKYFSGKPLIGCEVGVREGINAKRILQTLNVKKLYLVDPYMPYYEPLIPLAMSEEYQRKVEFEAHVSLASYATKTVWFACNSDMAFQSSIIHDLDFCYIDGDHNYNQVKRDLENYSTLIKPGGVIGGHDFSTEYMMLCKAVCDFKNKNPKWILDGKFWDWWFTKK